MEVLLIYGYSVFLLYSFFLASFIFTLCSYIRFRRHQEHPLVERVPYLNAFSAIKK
jgi:hypothetical protein